jgi:hypothetical protein
MVSNLVTALLLDDLNQPDPNRTITVQVVNGERISTVTRADGTQFQVVVSQPTPGKAGGTARIVYGVES